MGGVLNYHAGAPGCDLQHHIKPDMVDHGCNHSTHEVKEMSGLEVQGHPWLHGEFKTGLNLRDLISKEKQNKQTNSALTGTASDCPSPEITGGVPCTACWDYEVQTVEDTSHTHHEPLHYLSDVFGTVIH